MQTNEEIQTAIKSLISCRGDNRREQIRSIALSIYDNLKEKGFLSVGLIYFKDFLPSEVEQRTAERILKDIISVLEVEGKVKKGYHKRSIKGLYQNPLRSQEAKISYKIMSYTIAFNGLAYNRKALNFLCGNWEEQIKKSISKGSLSYGRYSWKFSRRTANIKTFFLI